MKTLRKAYGLTQEQLAGWLHLTRSQLSVAETENRNLPLPAVEKIAQLTGLLSLPQNPTQLTAANNQQQQALKKALAARKKELDYQHKRLTRELQVLQGRYQQCSNALLAVQQLLHTVPTGSKGKQDRLWLEIWEADTLKKLEGCGPMAQQLVQLEIGVVEDELERIGKGS